MASVEFADLSPVAFADMLMNMAEEDKLKLPADVRKAAIERYNADNVLGSRKPVRNGHAHAAQTSDEKQTPNRFRVLTGDDLAALLPARERIRDIFPAVGVGTIYGAWSSGKSFITLDVLGAIESGRDWFGHRVEQCPTTYVALEGAEGVRKRWAAYKSRYQDAPTVRFITQPFNLLSPADITDMAAAIRAAGGADGVVALDTLNRSVPGTDENGSKDMGLIIAAAQALQSELGGLVLLVHHCGKDATKGPRGHSSLIAALDAGIEVQHESGCRALRIAKEKDGPDGQVYPIHLEIVEVGTDDYGDPVTSCVVVPDESAADAIRRVKLPQGGNQRIVWDAIGELLRNATHFGQGGAPLSRPCLRLEDAIEGCRGRLTCLSDRQTERVGAAITGLVTRGLLGLREGWLWAI